MECLCSFAVAPSPSLTCRVGTRRALSKLAFFSLSPIFIFRSHCRNPQNLPTATLVWQGFRRYLSFSLCIMIVACVRYHYRFFSFSFCLDELS